MNQKDIGIVILAIAVIVLAGVAYYLYSGVNECKAAATSIGTRLVECGAGAEQLQSGLGECQKALISLQQMCARYIPAQ